MQGFDWELFVVDSKQDASAPPNGKASCPLQGLDWEFAVIDDPKQNATAVPGGKIVVYTGLFRAVSDEDELAGVLAHEVAHILKHHNVRRCSAPLPLSPS